MDFQHHYSDDQERFRQEVSAWLDANLPPELADLDDLNGPHPATWDHCQAFLRRLGEKRWLALTEAKEWGGAAFTPEHAAILLEELEKRGLEWLLEETSSSLRQALHRYGTEAQKQTVLPAMARGQLLVWRHLLESGLVLDTNSLGVHLQRDGDDYILDGEGLFRGRGPQPDYLWTLALAHPEAPPEEAITTFLVPAGLEGISIRAARLLVSEEVHQVIFHQVRVPAHCLVGDEGEGWLIMHDCPVAEPATGHLSRLEREVEELFQYAQEATRDGVRLSEIPPLQQLLMEAYTNIQLTRLLHMRNSWMQAAGQTLTYHSAQEALWEEQTATRLSEIVREVMGIYALLDSQDPRAPKGGKFELQQRRSLAQQNPYETIAGYVDEIARCLGLDQSKKAEPATSHQRTPPGAAKPAGVSSVRRRA